MTFPKAPCNCIVDTWAFNHLPYHNFGAYVCTIRLLGAFGIVCHVLLEVPVLEAPAQSPAAIFRSTAGTSIAGSTT